ncbi:hypothetical protein LJC44_04470 [Parabacteroides sp. OttesenSCG-928-G06]|nr:hypothetical protein [Parabacteroides sp. OttesenSCG-928-K15]MDL2282345.1 hypothetical protein [Parabacteroides sp. OttesenSCG-928-G06]
MKSHAFFALSLLVCIGCDKPESKPVEPPSLITFSLSLSQEIIPFPESKSMPPLNIPGPQVETREGEEKELKDQCCTIEYIVYNDKETAPVRNVCYSLQENNLDFGIISDTLEKGVYTIILLAHNSPAGTLAGSTMTFDRVSDTFYLLFELEIEAGQVYHQEVTLSRIVSRIEFVSTDVVPADAGSFAMAVARYPGAIDIQTGEGVVDSSDPVTFTHTFTETEKGTTGLTHAFYSFIPAEEATMDITLTAYTEEAEVLRSREVSAVQPQRNRIVRYTGRLYSYSPSDDEFTVVIDDVWDTPVEEVLPD